MGYTHYWTFKRIPKGQTKQVNKAYTKAVKECQKIILAYQNIAPSDERLSGYSAHTKLGQYLGVNFNGKGNLAHETFILRDFFKHNSGFNFCKTAHKPYDVVVVACLAVLKDCLKELVEVSSDGRAWEFENGVQLASVVLKRRIQNPIKTPGLGIVG